jgi:hypothetical protein
MLPANQGVSDNANVIVGATKCQYVQDWSQGTTEAELHKYHDVVRVSIASMSKYPWFVSSWDASLDPGKHVSNLSFTLILDI